MVPSLWPIIAFASSAHYPRSISLDDKNRLSNRLNIYVLVCWFLAIYKEDPPDRFVSKRKGQILLNHQITDTSRFIHLQYVFSIAVAIDVSFTFQAISLICRTMVLFDKWILETKLIAFTSCKPMKISVVQDWIRISKMVWGSLTRVTR